MFLNYFAPRAAIKAAQARSGQTADNGAPWFSDAKELDMTPEPTHARRQFLCNSASAASALVILGAAGCVENLGHTAPIWSLRAAADAVARLAQAPDRRADVGWNWAQTLEHCAQSIEYSMTGFPVMKPVLFQRTVGAAAFAVFSWRGRMSHDLAEPIPGAPAIDPAGGDAHALARLQAAVAAFTAWSGPLQPHFAYGPLGKAAYERAHALHIANHLTAFRG